MTNSSIPNEYIEHILESMLPCISDVKMMPIGVFNKFSDNNDYAIYKNKSQALPFGSSVWDLKELRKIKCLDFPIDHRSIDWASVKQSILEKIFNRYNFSATTQASHTILNWNLPLLEALITIKRELCPSCHYMEKKGQSFGKKLSRYQSLCRKTFLPSSRICWPKIDLPNIQSCNDTSTLLHLSKDMNYQGSKIDDLCAFLENDGNLTPLEEKKMRRLQMFSRSFNASFSKAPSLSRWFCNRCDRGISGFNMDKPLKERTTEDKINFYAKGILSITNNILDLSIWMHEPERITPHLHLVKAEVMDARSQEKMDELSTDSSPHLDCPSKTKGLPLIPPPKAS
ncbi:MAG: hypothetical protein LBE38_08185 [Deltaproteobacteria bacterium]|jgi:hypothetical protein|nr:hypothetical protein [Deltaproteobacteria bacterium]